MSASFRSCYTEALNRIKAPVGSLRWDLEQNPGRSKCALVSLKSCAKKPLPAAFLVIYLE